jgi:hypothetical protein
MQPMHGQAKERSTDCCDSARGERTHTNREAYLESGEHVAMRPNARSGAMDHSRESRRACPRALMATAERAGVTPTRGAGWSTELLSLTLNPHGPDVADANGSRGGRGASRDGARPLLYRLGAT